MLCTLKNKRCFWQISSGIILLQTRQETESGSFSKEDMGTITSSQHTLAAEKKVAQWHYAVSALACSSDPIARHECESRNLIVKSKGANKGHTEQTSKLLDYSR